LEDITSLTLANQMISNDLVQNFMKRYFYSDTIYQFRNTETHEILGRLAINNEFSLEQTQKDAWLEEIFILKEIIKNFQG
jgi:hypothetical protein